MKGVSCPGRRPQVIGSLCGQTLMEEVWIDGWSLFPDRQRALFRSDDAEKPAASELSCTSYKELFQSIDALNPPIPAAVAVFMSR
jgi:hypothetical protein